MKWADCNITFWLYFCGRPLTAIRAHVTASPTEVRQKAIREAAILYPGSFNHLLTIAHSEVRR